MVLSEKEWEPVKKALKIKHTSPPKLYAKDLEKHVQVIADFVEVLEKRRNGDENFAKQAHDLVYIAENMAEFSHMLYRILKTRPSWEAIDASLAVL